MASVVQELEGLVDELCKEDEEERCDGIANQLMDLSHSLHSLGGEVLDRLVKEKGSQMEQCALTLWNIAVAKKSGTSITDILNAKLRHLASNLAFTSGLSADNFTVQKRHVMMASKAASAWLDCDQLPMAEQCLTLSLEGLDKLKRHVQTAGDSGLSLAESAWMAEKKKEVDREAFKIYCYKAKVSVAQEDHSQGLEWIEKATALLSTLTTETSLLAKLCYNFGCDAQKSEKFESAVSWLRQSYELGKDCHDIDSKMQAKTLRLLASAYLDWDAVQYSQKALNAVSLANAEHSHPFGLHLKIKIILLSETIDSKLLQAAVEEAIVHKDLSVELAIETVKLLAKHDKNDLSLTACRRLTSRFAGSAGLGKLLVLQLELLTRNKRLQQARSLVETIISDHHAALDGSALRQLHVLLWEQAAEAYEGDDCGDALVWYNFSLSLLADNPDMEKTNIAKLQRNRASCYIRLQQFQKAEEAMGEAERNDPSNLYTHYLLFKVAINQGKDEQAIAAIQKLGAAASGQETTQDLPHQEEVHSLISLAAQLAFERSNKHVAIAALENLVHSSMDPRQILTCFRCLTRLRLTLSEGSRDPKSEANVVAEYLESVLVHLKSLAELEVVSLSDEETRRNEAAWFMKVAWNLAIEHSTDSRLTCKFFELCGKLCELLPNDANNLGRQKTCLVMAAAAGLQTAREMTPGGNKTPVLEKVLEHVETCRNICHLLQNLGDGDAGSKDRAPSMLLLHEFEALAKLGRQSALENLITQALSSSAHDIKTIETLAALAIEPPAHYKQLSKRLLQAALDRHLKSPQVDLERCSKTVHSLIRLCLGEGESPQQSGREEAWGHYKVVLKVLESEHKEKYPEMEILWLMTKAWNTGIYSYSAGQYSLADVWCSLGMELMGHLTGLKRNYEEKMTSLFSEIQAKVSSTKVKENMEE
ncbi:testis-expressed protein 11-like [Diadema antillarum]|uniref:testis-expressed protein 11-like n=1 Tax=Diadema antillarum TaxID=105358 RepID=UPI003A887CE9